MKARTTILLLAGAALAAKVYCALTTIGTTDTSIFFTWAKCIQMVGLIETYKLAPLFNHTPFVGWFSYQILNWSGDDLQRFAFFLRIPAILADFVAVLALIWLREKTGRPAWWAIALFALSPVGFILSGFHGNVDSVVAVCIMLAAIACARGNPALCGLFLGLGLNFKVTPLLLAPVFFFYYWERRQILRFGIPAAVLVAIGWGYPLLVIPHEFYRNVLGYASVWGNWGITYFLRMTGIPAFQGINMIDHPPEQMAVIQALKVFVIGAVLAWAWLNRKVEPALVYRSAAVVWAIFFTFAPGFAVQYLIWLAPCFLVASERWYATLTLTSSIALGTYYLAAAGHIFQDTSPEGGAGGNPAVPLLLLPWLVIVGYLAYQLRESFIAQSQRPVPPTEPEMDPDAVAADSQ